MKSMASLAAKPFGKPSLSGSDCQGVHLPFLLLKLSGSSRAFTQACITFIISEFIAGDWKSRYASLRHRPQDHSQFLDSLRFTEKAEDIFEDMETYQQRGGSI